MFVGTGALAASLSSVGPALYVSSGGREGDCYAGDPLVDFTLYAFVDKFMHKKPRDVRDRKPSASVTKWKRGNGQESDVFPSENDEVETFAQELAQGMMEEEEEAVDLDEWSDMDELDEVEEVEKVDAVEEHAKVGGKRTAMFVDSRQL
ncbi:hypothetical protein PsorP6_010053 [Peronosclerospora sorghi]|uniref:Uncharacterized protein n=1 Tax=Peronosclerospora sorghi TaxID=230839 RepID=A0ACC0VTD5_9STRA|nr:hypothetical protein PsorP6_010053 [Peronosclerospora sorghi]